MIAIGGMKAGDDADEDRKEQTSAVMTSRRQSVAEQMINSGDRTFGSVCSGDR